MPNELERSPEQIAAGLSEAQRRYLTTQAVWAKPRVYSQERWMTFPPPATHRVLMEKNLVDAVGQIRGLGLSVRQYLLDQEKGQ